MLTTRRELVPLSDESELASVAPPSVSGVLADARPDGRRALTATSAIARRGYRRVTYEARRLSSRARIESLRLRFPSLEIDSASFVESGCEFSCPDGSRMRVRESYIGRRCVLFAAEGGVLDIAGTRLGQNSVVAAHEAITIDEGCSIAEMVVVRDHDHLVDEMVPLDSGAFVTAPIQIGRRVWIGAKASVLKGVTVGADAVIGAHSVVRDDVEPRSLYAGVPARKIR